MGSCSRGVGGMVVVLDEAGSGVWTPGPRSRPARVGVRKVRTQRQTQYIRPLDATWRLFPARRWRRPLRPSSSPTGASSKQRESLSRKQ